MLTKHRFKLTPIAVACALAYPALSMADEATTLAPVVVSDTVTQAPVAESNRLGTSLRETPQAISVVGAEEIRAQNADRLEDVLRTVPGVTQTSGHSGIFSNYVLRGFQLDNISGYFKDGLRTDRQSALSLQNIEQVEVVRGPASMQYGKLVPGGLVNFVTKKPQRERHHEVTASVNSFGQVEGGVDTTGAFNDSVLYRLNGEAKRIESFRDGVDGEAYMVSPAFTFLLGTATTLEASTEHNWLDTIRDPGQPAPDGATIGSVRDLDPEWFYGEEDAENDVHTDAARLRLSHQLNTSWLLRADYANARYERDMFFTLNLGLTPDFTAVRRAANTGDTDQRFETQRVEALGQFATGPVNHRLLVGADRAERRIKDVLGTRTALDSVPLRNPDPTGNAVYDTTPSEITRSESDNHGVYLQDQMDLGPVSLMLGVRRDWLDEEVELDDIAFAGESSFASETDTDAYSPSAGLLYRVSPQLSLYSSYARSLDSNVAQDPCGRSFSPSRGEQYEAGAKGAAFGENLQWAVTAFDLYRKDALVDDPSGATDATGFFTCQVAGGEQRSTGVELEVSGRVTPALRLHGSYTRLNARITDDAQDETVTREGNKLRNAPKHSGRIWTEYDVTQGLALSLGATYVDERFANDANTLTIPSYVVWDAGARYRFNPQHSLQLGVKNLTDRQYVEDASQNRNSINQGAPVAASLRYTVTF